jgi:hypothetical protein
METVPYLDLRAQYRTLRSEVLSALEEICESTSFAHGPAPSEFEAKFAAYCGVDHCVSLNSGTSALHLALRCLDVGPGDEVVTVSMTFIATAWDPANVFPSRLDLGPDRLDALLPSRHPLLCGLAIEEKPKLWKLILICICAELGFFDKFNFVWLIAAFVLGILLCYPDSLKNLWVSSPRFARWGRSLFFLSGWPRCYSSFWPFCICTRPHFRQ